MLVQPLAFIPKIPFWHVWTDLNGISHQSQQWMEGFVLEQLCSGTDSLWVGPRRSGKATMLTLVLPSGYVGEWHENPSPQWILPVSGCWSVETMDGQVVEMGPGQISFGGDQNTRSDGERHGHRSRALGQQPAVLLLVQVSPEMCPPIP